MSLDEDVRRSKQADIDKRLAAFAPNRSFRPSVLGTRGMVVSGHYLASLAGWQVLEMGGNAVDAGVAVGLATNVVESVFTGIGGVAPCLLYLAERDEVIAISGVGTLPKAASMDFFVNEKGGAVNGIHATVVPAAMDAWLTALEQYGTLSFADVAASALGLAAEGFPVYPFLARLLDYGRAGNQRYESNAAIYLPGGTAPRVGEMFYQRDLARTLGYLVDEEAAHARFGREEGIRAARRAFYEGDIAARMVQFHRDNGGFLTREDLAGFRVGIEPPSAINLAGARVFAGGPYSQGPSLLQALKILSNADLKALGHNSIEYIHLIAETIKLVAADRDAYLGDPRFIDVPLEALLSDEYGQRRFGDIAAEAQQRAIAGRIGGEAWPSASDREAGRKASGEGSPASNYGTSYFCVVDRDGNIFSATPSDGASNGANGAVVPGLGFLPSVRGISLWADPDHPSCVAPGKRPRLTMGPAIVFDRGRVSAFGTPGTDVQLQAMLQTFFAVELFGMDPQEAVEAPRFASYGFPGSFYPHAWNPGRLNLEAGIPEATGAGLAERGHDVVWWPDNEWLAGSMCYVRKNVETGIISAGADPRRTAYAIGA